MLVSETMSHFFHKIGGRTLIYKDDCRCPLSFNLYPLSFILEPRIRLRYARIDFLSIT